MAKQYQLSVWKCSSLPSPSFGCFLTSLDDSFQTPKKNAWTFVRWYHVSSANTAYSLYSTKDLPQLWTMQSHLSDFHLSCLTLLWCCSLSDYTMTWSIFSLLWLTHLCFMNLVWSQDFWFICLNLAWSVILVCPWPWRWYPGPGQNHRLILPAVPGNKQTNQQKSKDLCTGVSLLVKAI